jgi:hypothetical protein
VFSVSLNHDRGIIITHLVNTRWTRLKALKSANARLLRFIIIGELRRACTRHRRILAKDKIHREALRIGEGEKVASPRCVTKLLDLTGLW